MIVHKNYFEKEFKCAIGVYISDVCGDAVQVEAFVINTISKLVEVNRLEDTLTGHSHHIRK